MNLNRDLNEREINFANKLGKFIGFVGACIFLPFFLIFRFVTSMVKGKDDD